jgi:hypothetical protein
MDSNILYERFEMLPEPLKKEASDFIDFLFQKAMKEDMAKNGKPVFGSAKGKIHMAPDFDEPLEDFKEYM